MAINRELSPITLLQGVLTVVAERLDVPSLTNHIQTEVVLDRVEVMRAREHTAVQPADEECKGELVKIIEGQLFLGGSWCGCQQLFEEGDFVGEQIVGHLEDFVGDASAKDGDRDVCRRRSLAAWVVGMNTSDE